MSGEERAVSGRDSREVATLGGGCFWCLEAVFEQLKGVRSVVSGYSGGTVPNPSYEQVCTGETGHAEVVQLTFDPEVIAFREILEVFFDVHDPTTLNRQGADVGTQYRSVVFYHDGEQKAVAEQLIQELDGEGRWDEPIVTELLPYEAFYGAEGYHQAYFQKHAQQPYCRAVVAPKVSKFRKKYSLQLKT